ncbi:MAG: class I SAM-dependent methyltransferase [Acidobacteria bacterium]|nr:class I SAM-dependent methyltransferase [Acidobacteriota bacterium]
MRRRVYLQGIVSFVLFCLALTVAAQIRPVTAWQQPAPQKRKPARPLPAERAAILLSEFREKYERPEEIIDRMNLKDGDLVADLGAGLGYYSLRLAKRTGPRGAVFAVDIQQGMLDQLQGRMKEAGIRNIYPVLGDEADPKLPPGKMDWILLVDSYHEFGQPELMLEKIRHVLAPDGRVALIEYRAEQDPKEFPLPIPRDHKMTAAEVLSEWLPAGFELVAYYDFLPLQHYFVFRKAERK